MAAIVGRAAEYRLAHQEEQTAKEAVAFLTTELTKAQEAFRKKTMKLSETKRLLLEEAQR